MIIMQIVEVRLKRSANALLTARDFQRVTDWLTQWTPQRNFKAVITATSQQAMDQLRGTLQRELVPSWLDVKPEHFEFRVSWQDTGGSNEFWMSSGLGPSTWHAVE